MLHRAVCRDIVATDLVFRMSYHYTLRKML